MKCTEQYLSVVLFFLRNEPCGNVFIYLNLIWMKSFIRMKATDQNSPVLNKLVPTFESLDESESVTIQMKAT